jgi:hypothetical protein
VEAASSPINILLNIDPARWLLIPPRDTASSRSLEVAVTAFQVWGLELDRTIAAWEAARIAKGASGAITTSADSFDRHNEPPIPDIL